MKRKRPARCEDLLSQTAAHFPEINTPALRLISRLFRLREVIFENAQREMARFELSAAEFSVLSTLRKAPTPFERRPSEIYKGMLLTSGGLTKILKALEARGLIERVGDEADRRSSRVRLTSVGVEIAEAAMKAVIASDTAMLNRVADSAALDAIAESLRPFTEVLDR
ncbi:MAG: MarR family transcriptional regulator [Thauera sp.]|jgi:DNA-binding MarR family transcriptional regulator|nr:MarR family transcriptional regulator [Thauera sp.]